MNSLILESEILWKLRILLLGKKCGSRQIDLICEYSSFVLSRPSVYNIPLLLVANTHEYYFADNNNKDIPAVVQCLPVKRVDI
jgi:hypothetical protein